MKIKYLILLTLLFVGYSMSAQTSTFTRGKGFVIRPELYGGFCLNAGYQFNPYFQITVGAGITIDPTVLGQVGVRAYTNEGKWAAMFDYHYRRGRFSGYAFSNHALVAGASFKDLDFGAGIQLSNIMNNTVFGPLFTIGWNIRCYKHR